MSSPKSVQVALRIRPLVDSEVARGCKDVLEVYTDVQQVKIRDTDKAFTYNYVFGPKVSQDELYNKCIGPLLKNIYEGYNLTLLAYGQTGSGKTHSMGTTYSGDAANLGIIPRAIKEIFSHIKDNFAFDFTTTVSFMELYQETLYDLLSNRPKDQSVLDIREDAKGIQIPNLTEVAVSRPDEVFAALIKGSEGRATAATNMNSQSSRSHAIFTLNLCIQDKNNPLANKTSKLHFVDLAGSERPKKTGAVGNTFKEGVTINKGLLVLGNVISALGDEKQAATFVPYRDSNLTRLLKDSLGGNSITLMLACVSPADYNVDETLSTMRYADRAKKIQNKPIVNQDPKTAEINALKKTIQQLRLQLIGENGDSSICPAEIELLRKENHELHIKISELSRKLSTAVHTNTDLLEKIMILQNATEAHQTKLKKLQEDCDATFHDLSIGISNNDNDLIKTKLENLVEIKQQLCDINNQQHDAKEIFMHESIQCEAIADEAQDNANASPELKKKREEYMQTQMELYTQIDSINKQLSLKQHLARTIERNINQLVDYEGMAENEKKIVQLQKEKDELMQQLKNAQSGKLAEQRRKRVQELEKSIQDLKKKLQEQARLIKMKEKDEIRIKRLNTEIVTLKQDRVKLHKKSKDENERFRQYKLDRERQFAKLKQEDQRKLNKIKQMEIMHSKKQNVLKRKMEEAVALNKRLKESMALRKNIQQQKFSNKTDKLGTWLKHELDVYENSVAARISLKHLIEDRSTLQQQLDQLKANGSDNEKEISELEEDIELRSAQINELQQKLIDSEESSCSFDNIQQMGDAKFALKMLWDSYGELKKKQMKADMNQLENQSNYTDLKGKINNLEEMIRTREEKHRNELAETQQECENKITVLLEQLRGVEYKGTDDQLKSFCQLQEERNQQLVEQLKQLQEANETLKKEVQQQKLNAIKQEPDCEINEEAACSTSANDKTFLTPKNKILRKKLNTTYDIKNSEETDTDLSFEDDIAKDPDWKNTPLGKWLSRSRKVTLNPNENVMPRMAIKRGSDENSQHEPRKSKRVLKTIQRPDFL